MFGGKGRVVTCEMVVCPGFDVLRHIASGIELHCRCISKCVRICDKLHFNAHIYTHTRIRTQHTHTHACAHIYKLRLFIIL